MAGNGQNGSDWISLAFERFTNATRNLRLTLPPCRDEEFWSRLVELAKMRPRGLAITVLLDSDPRSAETVSQALNALPELDAAGHEVSWTFHSALPYSVFIIDDAWSLMIAGNPDDENGAGYVRLTDTSDEVINLRDVFDRHAAHGIWDVDPSAWSEWLQHAAHRQPTRSPLSTQKRSGIRLKKLVLKELKNAPKRSCWMMKPRDSAYGIAEPPGQHHWLEWRDNNFVAFGWPAICEQLDFPSLPTLIQFRKVFEKHYKGRHNLTMAYSALKHFLDEMKEGDRVVAVEGWTAKQKSSVRFHGWTRVYGDAKLDEFTSTWPLQRDVAWNSYSLDLPVKGVRAATGLDSATAPIHKVSTGAYRRLIALADEVRRTKGDSQLLLDFALINNTPSPDLFSEHLE